MDTPLSPKPAISEMSSPSPPASNKKSGRPPNEAYIKLMRPDEDWRTMADAAERRRIQNRLAQRAYRRNLREKNREVEKLKKQLHKLQGTTKPQRRGSSKSDSTGPVLFELDMSNGTESIESGSSESSEAAGWGSYSLSTALDLVEPIAPNDMNFMFFDFPTDFDGSRSQSSGIQSSVDAMESEAAKMTSRNNTPGGRSPHTSSFESEPELTTSYLSTHLGTEIQGPLSYSGSNSGSVGECFSLAYASPGLVPLPSPPFRQLPNIGSQSPDPDASINLNSLGIETLGADASPHWSPDADASLLHFAVAGGDIETLRLLLKHQPNMIEIRDSGGYTPIQRAIMTRRPDMVALLLEHREALANGGRHLPVCT